MSVVRYNSKTVYRLHMFDRVASKYTPIPDRMRKFIEYFEDVELSRSDKFDWYTPKTQPGYHNSLKRYFDEYRYNNGNRKKKN